MLLLPTEATVEDKTNTCTDLHHPTYIEDQKLLDSCTSTHHNQHRQRRDDRKISNGKGSLGHCRLLSSKWTLTHWKWQGCFHAVSTRFRVFDVTRVALMAKHVIFRSKNKHKLFWSLLTTRACGKRAGLMHGFLQQFGIRGCPPLLAQHTYGPRRVVWINMTATFHQRLPFCCWYKCHLVLPSPYIYIYI